MKVTIGDYKIESDSNCFVLKSVRPNEKGEKISKTIGYYTSVEGVLGDIPKSVLKENDDIGTIIKKLSEIKVQIGGVKAALERAVR